MFKVLLVLVVLTVLGVLLDLWEALDRSVRPGPPDLRGWRDRPEVTVHQVPPERTGWMVREVPLVNQEVWGPGGHAVRRDPWGRQAN